MADRLMLVRHGKAEDHGTRPDYDRRLTEKGSREIKAVARELAVFLQGMQTVIITSPLVRAKQTAELLAEAIHASVEQEIWIADGVFSRVLQMRDRPEDVVILVGHNPDFDHWHFRLTGEERHFKKGAVALYHWKDGDPPAIAQWLKTAKQIAKGVDSDEA